MQRYNFLSNYIRIHLNIIYRVNDFLHYFTTTCNYSAIATTLRPFWMKMPPLTSLRLLPTR